MSARGVVSVEFRWRGKWCRVEWRRELGEEERRSVHYYCQSNCGRVWKITDERGQE